MSRDGGWRLPETINPPRKCVTLQIPDELHHRLAFWDAIYSLTRWYNWQRDDGKIGREVGAVWTDVLERALAGEVDCEGGGIVTRNFCREFYPRAPFIDFQPNSPFRIDEPQVPPGYAARPWFLPDSYFDGYPLDWIQQAGTLLVNALQDLQPTDVISLYLSQPAFSPLSGYPRYSINVRGVGQVELHMLNVPLGGRAIVTVDFLPDFDEILAGSAQWGELYIIETNWDAVAIPPETAQLQVQEINLTSPGDHVIHVTLVPVVNDEAIFIQYGGGLRKVVLCGDDLYPIWPEGTEGEGEIIMTDPCGCDGLRGIISDVLLAAAAGATNQVVPPGSEVGEDGRINPGTGDEPYIPTQPELPDFAAPALQAGAAYRAASGLKKAVADIYIWMQETTCWDGLNWLLPFQEECYGYVWNIASAIYDINREALDEFMLWLVNDTTATWIVSEDELAEYFFCVGVNPQAVANYAVREKSGEERDFYLKLRNVFASGQYDYWRTLGATQPRSDYGAFKCVPRNTVEYQFSPVDIGTDFNNRSIIPDASWQAKPHDTLVSITLSGTVTDGAIQEDPLYRFDGANRERRFIGLHLGQSSPVKPIPDDDAFPTYSAGHDYSFTFVIPANKGGDWRLFWDADTDFGIPYPAYDSVQSSAVGQFAIKIIDLGEV